MKDTTYSDSKQGILEGTFTYLVKKGLENVRIRDLCDHLGYTQNTLYYWFKNKDDLIIKAALCGLQSVSHNIFDYIFVNIDDLDKFLEHSLETIKEHKMELRSIYQLACSPVYGDQIRKNCIFTPVYDKYAAELAEHIGCDAEKVTPIIYMFAAAVLDYAIWEENTEIEIQLEFIKGCLERLVRESQEAAEQE